MTEIDIKVSFCSTFHLFALQDESILLKRFHGTKRASTNVHENEVQYDK